MSNPVNRKKITQHQAIFYQLYKKHKADPMEYTPIWQLIGEVFCAELNVWGFVSYEVSARVSELYKDNPTLFERTQVTGKTGATYFAYRIALGAKERNIADADLLQFFKDIRGYENLEPVRVPPKDFKAPQSLTEPIITRVKSTTYPYPEYVIKDYGTRITCTCQGYQFRRECKHTKKRSEQIVQSMQQPIF